MQSTQTPARKKKPGYNAELSLFSYFQCDDKKKAYYISVGCRWWFKQIFFFSFSLAFPLHALHAQQVLDAPPNNRIVVHIRIKNGKNTVTWNASESEKKL